MFLLIFIFIVVILFSLSSSYISDMSALIVKHLFKISDEEMFMRTQIRSLKTEQESVRVIDEFARYVKLQRRIDKLAWNLKQYGRQRSTVQTVLKYAIRFVLNLIHLAIMLSLVFSYKHEPICSVPVSWLFPFHIFVAFPTGIPGGVGIVCWIVACNTMVYRAKRLVDY